MFQRRLLWVTALLLAGMAILIARLIWLQVIQGQNYVDLSQIEYRPPGNCTETVRGQILDYRGQVLAFDRPTFDICLHYKLTRLYDLRYRTYRLAENIKPEKQQQVRLELNRQREQADELLAKLARLCNIPLEEIRSEINQINDNLFLMQAVQARKRYYQSLDIQYPQEPNALAIWSDFVKQVPDPKERLQRIFQPESAVWEMDQPQTVIQNVSEDVALTVEDRLIGAWIGDGRVQRWISITTGKKRQYPYGDIACHILGQVRKVPREMVNLTDSSDDPNQKELKGYRHGDRVGEWGVEFLFEDRLKGQRGWIRYGTDQQVAKQTERILGQNVTLTVDVQLHRRIQQCIAGDNPQQPIYLGAAVVIDVPTGHIRALVSVPTFDLNTYYQIENWQFLNGGQDSLKRKLNRAIYKNYTPGSTIKPTLLLGALEEGYVSRLTRYDCLAGREGILPGSVCFKYGHGSVDVIDSIKRSCNYFYIDVGRRMGAVKVIECLEKAGFGRKVLAWPEGISGKKSYGSFRETAGVLVPNPSPTQLKYMCVGLGPINSNIVQIANGMATIARNGIFINPTLIQEPKTPVLSRRISTSPQNIRLVQQAMQAVIYDMGGTAFKAFQSLSWPKEQVALFGKTGTTNNESLFAGFAKCPDGREIALAVVVEDPAGGGAYCRSHRQTYLRCLRRTRLPAPSPSGNPKSPKPISLLLN